MAAPGLESRGVGSQNPFMAEKEKIAERKEKKKKKDGPSYQLTWR